MNERLIALFKETYPDLKIKQIKPYKRGKLFVVADAKNGGIAMDPFFVYDETEKTFTPYSPLSNFEEFQRLMAGTISSF